MAANKFDDLSSINQGRRDWKIKVKVVRFWRGATKEGQFFSNFKHTVNGQAGIYPINSR